MAINELDFVVRSLGDPKASQGIFDLPCGYVDAEGKLHREVKVREMTGYEEDLLTSKSTPFHKKMNELLARCIERVGEITDRSKIISLVPELTVGDRTFLVFAIRRVSLGEEFPLKEQCPECKTESMYTIMLGNLDIQTMAEPLKRIFEVKVPSGKVVQFRSLLGRDEETIAKLSKKSDDALSLAMQVRVQSIDGVPPTMEDLKMLGVRDRDFLREQFNLNDGGVDTTVEMQCPNESCGTEFETNLNMGQVGFFFPSAMKKPSKRRSSI